MGRPRKDTNLELNFEREAQAEANLAALRERVHAALADYTEAQRAAGIHDGTSAYHAQTVVTGAFLGMAGAA